MSDPLSTSLSQLTPDTSRLDRDALLYAAGRASVQPNHFWKGLSSWLALTQATTLIFLCHMVPMAAKTVIPPPDSSSIARVKPGPEQSNRVEPDHSLQRLAGNSMEWIEPSSVQIETIDSYPPAKPLGVFTASDPSLFQ